MLKIKVGDSVKILSGKDKGREGKVEKLFPKSNRVLVPGINMYKKHVKSTPSQKGGIFDIPRPMAISKVGIICPKCKKVTRIGFKLIQDEKVRICRKCGKEMVTKK
jgi:large subunit ribosomal protein L24